jgi:hypothetical protein
VTGPEQAPPPSVSTAPAEGGSSGTTSPRAPLGRRRLPAHLGPARTSTVLLAVAFLAVGLLYLFVKPPAEAATGGTGTDPARTTAPTVPTTSAPAAPTTEQPTSAPEETPAPTSEVVPTPSEEPTEPTVEEPEPSVPGETTAPAPGTTAPLPDTAAPTS